MLLSAYVFNLTLEIRVEIRRLSIQFGEQRICVQSGGVSD